MAQYGMNSIFTILRWSHGSDLANKSIPFILIYNNWLRDIYVTQLKPIRVNSGTFTGAAPPLYGVAKLGGLKPEAAEDHLVIMEKMPFLRMKLAHQ